MIYFGKDTIASLFYGRKEVIKVIGCNGAVVWEKQAPEPEPEPEPPTPTTGYFTTVAKNDGTISFSGTSYSSDSLSFVNALSYSTDSGATWSEASQNVTVSVAEGAEVWWKGVSERGIAFNGPNANSGIGRFSSSVPFDLKGNIMSLIYGDSFEGKTSLASKPHALLGTFFNSRVVDASELILPATEFYPLYGAYRYMFYGCTSLTAAPQLPATTLVQNAYQGMFQGCTSLTTAPQLPATTLANNCYDGMFSGCTSLTTAPQELPATTLADSCYYDMFSYCTSLTAAPQLPATTLATSCYSWMFQACTSLTTPPQLPATTLAEKCYVGMFYDCTSLATAPQLLAETLVSYCYNVMFKGCTSLNSITCLATDINLFNNCTSGWLSNVASSGTFTKAASMTSWPSGDSGIPDGWTVQDY